MNNKHDTGSKGSGIKRAAFDILNEHDAEQAATQPAAAERKLSPIEHLQRSAKLNHVEAELERVKESERYYRTASELQADQLERVKRQLAKMRQNRDFVLAQRDTARNEAAQAQASGARLLAALKLTTERIEMIMESSSLRVDWKSSGALRELKLAKAAIAAAEKEGK